MFIKIYRMAQYLNRMNKKIIFIAEAGVNHNGDMVIAKKLIDKAALAGADYIKFQTYNVEKLIKKNTLKTAYQIKNTGNTTDQYEMLQKLQLSKEDHIKLIKYSKIKKIKFLSSAFDIQSLKFLNQLKLDKIKIPSGEITNTPYLEYVAKLNKETILSTGMSTMREIQFALNILIKNGLKKNKITLLQCNTDYPTSINDANINAMVAMKKKFNIKVGYSDHTLGIESSLAAVALGARLIEKHFTLNKSYAGPDHAASITPIELKKLIMLVNNVKLALGSKAKKPTKSELKNKNLVRKKIFSSKEIKKGEIFSYNNLITLRGSSGVCASEWGKYIGKKSKKKYKKNTIIKKQ